MSVRTASFRHTEDVKFAAKCLITSAVMHVFLSFHYKVLIVNGDECGLLLGHVNQQGDVQYNHPASRPMITQITELN